MAATFKFFFINDTKQGPLLSYSRQELALEAGEQVDIFCGDRGYVHFTVKDSNFNKTGDESKANSIDGVGYITTTIKGTVNSYAIERMTYYTNNAFKEVYMRISLPGPFFHYKPQV